MKHHVHYYSVSGLASSQEKSHLVVLRYCRLFAKRHMSPKMGWLN